MLHDTRHRDPEHRRTPQTWQGTKASREPIRHKREQVIRHRRSRTRRSGKQGLIFRDEDPGGGVLAAVSRARGVSRVGSLRLPDTGAVEVRLCEGLGDYAVVVDVCEIIVEGDQGRADGRREVLGLEFLRVCR